MPTQRDLWPPYAKNVDKVVLLGEHHLRQVVTEYAAHYHRERNHQGLRNELIRAPSRTVTRAANENGQVRCHRRLGGLLKYYANEAA